MEPTRNVGIRIIQPGDLNRLMKIKRFSCNSCGCIWEADKNNYSYYSDQREGESYYIGKCPTCGGTAYAK